MKITVYTLCGLALPEGTAQADLDRRAIQNLGLITKGVAAIYFVLGCSLVIGALFYLPSDNCR